MKTVIALTLLIAPWLIFVWVAAAQKQPSTVGLVLTLAISAFGLTILISRKKK
jgi:hypothetical protein